MSKIIEQLVKDGILLHAGEVVKQKEIIQSQLKLVYKKIQPFKGKSPQGVEFMKKVQENLTGFLSLFSAKTHLEKHNKILNVYMSSPKPVVNKEDWAFLIKPFLKALGLDRLQGSWRIHEPSIDNAGELEANAMARVIRALGMVQGKKDEYLGEETTQAPDAVGEALGLYQLNAAYFLGPGMPKTLLQLDALITTSLEKWKIEISMENSSKGELSEKQNGRNKNNLLIKTKPLKV